MLRDGAHRRYNPLLDEWVLCSPHRLDRPWQGRVETPPAPAASPYETSCYLCPGNVRASGAINPQYTGTFSFENDFPAVLEESSAPSREDDIFRALPERGRCRVLCFAPRHDLTLARMPVGDVLSVVDAWASESDALAALDRIAYVQLFENKGDMMGCSNPHPHAQLWAVEHVPSMPARKLACQAAHFRAHGRDLLGDYAARERSEQERIVWSDEHWLAVVPFWAVWPYQTMLIPARRVGVLSDLRADERRSLAHALLQVTRRYDSLFETDTPYSMTWAAAPTARAWTDDGSWRLHAEFFPPLLRSATVRKFLVGYELAGEPQRDLTAEEAAMRLRAAHIAVP